MGKRGPQPIPPEEKAVVASISVPPDEWALIQRWVPKRQRSAIARRALLDEARRLRTAGEAPARKDGEMDQAEAGKTWLEHIAQRIGETISAETGQEVVFEEWLDVPGERSSLSEYMRFQVGGWTHSIEFTPDELEGCADDLALQAHLSAYLRAELERGAQEGKAKSDRQAARRQRLAGR